MARRSYGARTRRMWDSLFRPLGPHGPRYPVEIPDDLTRLHRQLAFQLLVADHPAAAAVNEPERPLTHRQHGQVAFGAGAQMAELGPLDYVGSPHRVRLDDG